jgi:hypothetical protein
MRRVALETLKWRDSVWIIHHIPLGGRQETLTATKACSLQDIRREMTLRLFQFRVAFVVRL